MKYSLLLISLLFITATLFSQKGGWKMQEFLTKNKIDTCLIYSYQCGDGSIGQLDSCAGSFHYLLWKKNDTFFFKQFKVCGSSEQILLENTNPLTFYLLNKEVIDTQEIYTPTAYEIKRNKRKTDTLVLTAIASHVCYYYLDFKVGKYAKEKFISTYDLDFKEFGKGKPNIFYQTNQKSTLKYLIDITAALINKLVPKFSGENQTDSRKTN